MPDKKPVPLGKPLALTDAELDALTTADEMQKTQAEAEKLFNEANPDLEGLLDAVEVSD